MNAFSPTYPHGSTASSPQVSFEILCLRSNLLRSHKTGQGKWKVRADNQCRCYCDSNRRVGDRRNLRTLVNQSKASSSKDQATEIGEPQEASPSSVTIETEHFSLD
jgi:hypothetical protein